MFRNPFASIKSRNVVYVVMNRVDTRIVREAFFRQNLQRPHAIFPNGPARRPITHDSDACGVLDCAHRRPSIVSERIRRKRVNRSVPIAVARQLMTACLYATYKIWKPARHPPYEEESRFRIILVEKIQYATRVVYYAGWALVPAFFRHGLSECLDHEVVFHIHAQDVCAIQLARSLLLRVS